MHCQLRRQTRYLCVTFVKDDVLMRKHRPLNIPATDEWKVYRQIAVPPKYRSEILELAHSLSMSGHLGVNKLENRILQHFYWPKLRKSVAEFMKTCHVCQMVGKPNQNVIPALMKPVPAFDEPFSRVRIDCVGSMPKTRYGNSYLLTIMCASTRFAEAIPLRKILSQVIIKALTKFFTQFGIPKEIQSDQSSNFTSRIISNASVGH